MILTTKEIYELALFARLTVQPPGNSDMAETSLTVDVGDVHDMDGYGIYHGPRACFTDYPEEGYLPLGEII